MNETRQLDTEAIVVRRGVPMIGAPATPAVIQPIALRRASPVKIVAADASVTAPSIPMLGAELSRTASSVSKRVAIAVPSAAMMTSTAPQI
jgi:hypothetical protein